MGFSLPTLVVYPGRDLLSSRLEIKRDRVGLLAEISSEFARRGINIFNTIAQISSEGRGCVFIISECKGPEVLEDLRRSLESIDGVGAVEMERSEIRGLMISGLFFPLSRAGRRIVLMVDSALKSLIEELTRILGEDPANAIIFRVGYEMGKGLGRVHLEIGEAVGLRDPLEILKHVLLPLFKSSGYGIASLEGIREGALRMVVRDSIEARVRGRSERPSCFLVKGMLKGALEEVLGRQVAMEESRCEAAGHDFCEFIASY